MLGAGGSLGRVGALESLDTALQRLREEHAGGGASSDVLDALARHALQADAGRAVAAWARLRRDAVEPLADAYRPDARRALARLVARLVTRARERGDARSRALDARLREWGLPDEAALLARADRRRRAGRCDVPRDAVRRVLVLSRITVGADVLLTSMALGKLARVFPRARLTLVGPRKNAALLAASGAIDVREPPVSRDGGLAEALSGWCAFAEDVAKESGREGGETLVVDPDSRLLQSGVLPMAPAAVEARVGFGWDPTAAEGGPVRTSLAVGFRDWLDETFGPDRSGRRPSPVLDLPAGDLERARRLRSRLDAAGCAALVAVSLGVGGNPRKRVGGPGAASPFEHALLRGLLRAGADVLLDRGAGEDELRRADALERALRADGVEVAAVREGGASPEPGPRPAAGRLLAFEGPVSAAAALIGVSDVFVGYDSQGQHVAAALGVDGVTVFAGHPHDRFPDLWRPLGRGRREVVRVDAAPASPQAQRALAAEVVARSRVAARVAGGGS